MSLGLQDEREAHAEAAGDFRHLRPRPTCEARVWANAPADPWNGYLVAGWRWTTCGADVKHHGEMCTACREDDTETEMEMLRR